jgi:hypothetical protein
MDLDWYSVHVEARPGAGVCDLTVGENAVDALMELLEEHDGIVSAATGSWDATISVRAPNAWEATLQGAPVVEELACKAGMPVWPIVRAEATRQDVLDAENARPTLPELVSVPEAAEMLGVSQQRVCELAAANASSPSLCTSSAPGSSGSVTRSIPSSSAGTGSRDARVRLRLRYY